VLPASFLLPFLSSFSFVCVVLPMFMCSSMTSPSSSSFLLHLLAHQTLAVLQLLFLIIEFAVRSSRVLKCAKSLLWRELVEE
jgi:hypothetical protein